VYELIIEGPDADNGIRETFPLYNDTVARNTYERLGKRGNHVTLTTPSGEVLDSDVTPDPWGAERP
jgi:hypothetical protein